MGAQTPEQRIVALIKSAATEAAPSPPPAAGQVIVYGGLSVVSSGVIHIHHYPVSPPPGAQPSLEPERK